MGCAAVGELPADLNDDTIFQGGVRVDLADLGMAVLEVQLKNIDFQLRVSWMRRIGYTSFF